MTAQKKENWDQYSDYLDLDSILDAQHMRSQKAGAPERDEMLFIIFHQIYELWFKQILYEFDDIQSRFSRDIVDDRDLSPVLKSLNRITLILKAVVQQLEVLETMNPQSFVDFREHLESASGFQSWQFRLMEIRLGLKREDRLKFNYQDYDEGMNDKHQTILKNAENNKTLFQDIDEWLARTPFVEQHNYRFWDSYKKSVNDMFDKRIRAMAFQNISDEERQKEVEAMNKGREKFEGLFTPEKHAELTEKGIWRMSWRALQSALFISIYRDEPVLQMPYRMLSHIMDIDVLLAKWRYGHALMVHRMVGISMGTGGSAGYGYLMNTLEKHRIYNDLFALSTYLIPSYAMPQLPDTVRSSLLFRYTDDKKDAS